MAALDAPRRKMTQLGLVRSRRGRLIAGVCAGIARRYGVSPWLIRLAFVASVLLPGPQFLGYVALWILMPKEPRGAR